MTDIFVQIVCTTPTSELAQSIAEGLVTERLAACVQISGPIKSIYQWEGKLEKSEEWTLTIKSTLAKYQLIEERIKELHSYDTPEIIATEIAEISEDYGRWIHESIN